MKRVIVFGGSGFLGSAIVKELKKDYNVYTFGRRSAGKNHLTGSILSKKDVEKNIQRGDILINLVGLSPLKKPKRASYEEVHVKGVKNIVKVAEKKNARLIHISALGANSKAETAYARTKGQAEKVIEQSKIKYTILRPSIIVDKDNEMIQLFSNIAWLSMFPNISAKVQPILRKDLVKFIILILKNKVKEKKVDLVGGEELSIFEIAKLVFQKKGHSCLQVPLCFLKIIMYLAASLHLGSIGQDQIKNLTIDNTSQSKVIGKYIKTTSFRQWLSKQEL